LVWYKPEKITTLRMEKFVPTPLLVLLLIIIIWSLPWKGLALWNAAKNSQKDWFILLLIVNTLGILEIIYLFYFAKKKMKKKDLMFWSNSKS
jgi:hypothetical protein